jgi:hypothetical protein
MADITMCINQACDMREDCYRAKATPAVFQSLCFFAPINGNCENYIEYKQHTKKAKNTGICSHNAL